MRILHTMIRVGDLDRSLRFYTESCGMRLLSRKDYPEGKFTLAFVGFAQNPEQAESRNSPTTGTRRRDRQRLQPSPSVSTTSMPPAIASAKPEAR